MADSDKFLEHFNAIERRLRETTQLGRDSRFFALVEIASRNDQLVRRFQDDLRKFGDLRNAIVHERAGNRVIAEPNDWAVQRIAAIAKQILQPPPVTPQFLRDVFILSDQAPIAEAVTAMHTNAFSQVPVYRDDTFLGLLTANTITRWLGANVNEDLVSLSETTVGQVLAHTEDSKHVDFMARDTTLVDVLERFLAREVLGKRLEAIVITHDGRPNTKPLGIVVVYDLAKINRLLDA